jgi:hypothetical protein
MRASKAVPRKRLSKEHGRLAHIYSAKKAAIANKYYRRTYQLKTELTQKHVHVKWR